MAAQRLMLRTRGSSSEPQRADIVDATEAGGDADHAEPDDVASVRDPADNDEVVSLADSEESGASGLYAFAVGMDLGDYGWEAEEGDMQQAIYDSFRENA